MSQDKTEPTGDAIRASQIRRASDQVAGALELLSPDQRGRVLAAIATLYGVGPNVVEMLSEAG